MSGTHCAPKQVNCLREYFFERLQSPPAFEGDDADGNQSPDGQGHQSQHIAGGEPVDYYVGTQGDYGTQQNQPAWLHFHAGLADEVPQFVRPFPFQEDAVERGNVAQEFVPNNFEF